MAGRGDSIAGFCSRPVRPCLELESQQRFWRTISHRRCSELVSRRREVGYLSTAARFWLDSVAVQENEYQPAIIICNRLLSPTTRPACRRRRAYDSDVEDHLHSARAW